MSWLSTAVACCIVSVALPDVGIVTVSEPALTPKSPTTLTVTLTVRSANGAGVAVSVKLTCMKLAGVPVDVVQHLLLSACRRSAEAMHPVVLQAGSVEPHIVRRARRRSVCHQLCGPLRCLHAPLGQQHRPAGAMVPHPPRQLNTVTVTQTMHHRSDLGDVKTPRPHTMPPPPPPRRVHDHPLTTQPITSRPVLDELAHRQDPAPTIATGDPLRQITSPQQPNRRLDHRRNTLRTRRAPRILQQRHRPSQR